MLENLSDTARKWLKRILIFVIALLLITLAWKLYKALKKPANAKYIQGGGALPAGWDPAPLVEELRDNMEGLSTANQNDRVFAKFNALNDNQMISVYNKWNDDVFGVPITWGLYGSWGTLTQSVNEESSYVELGVNNRDVMLANLNRLKLP